MKRYAMLVSLIAVGAPFPASAQYQSYGINFSNPVTAQMNTNVNTGIGSRLIYKMILKKHGLTEAQLHAMRTEEMNDRIQSGDYGPKTEDGRKPTPQAIAQTVVPSQPASRFKPAGKRLLLPEMVKSM